MHIVKEVGIVSTTAGNRFSFAYLDSVGELREHSNQLISVD